MINDITLDISGLGIIFYSLESVKHIEEGANYLSLNYNRPQDVVRHVIDGTIVGFGTSSPGEYLLRISDGYPSDELLNSCKFKTRLVIKVLDSRVYFNDSYALMEWNANHDSVPFIDLESGNYHVTLCGNLPESNILGDEQVINIYFERYNDLPKLKYNGVPIYCE